MEQCFGDYNYIHNCLIGIVKYRSVNMIPNTVGVFSKICHVTTLLLFVSNLVGSSGLKGDFLRMKILTTPNNFGCWAGGFICSALVAYVFMEDSSVARIWIWASLCCQLNLKCLIVNFYEQINSLNMHKYKTPSMLIKLSLDSFFAAEEWRQFVFIFKQTSLIQTRFPSVYKHANLNGSDEQDLLGCNLISVLSKF